NDFADAELRCPQPGLNARIVESVVCGRSVIATSDEVRTANTHGVLQQIILDTSWKNDMVPSDIDEVRVLLGRAYLQLFAGYRLSRVLCELVDEIDAWHISGASAEWTFYNFQAYWIANPGSVWNRNRALAVVTRESIRQDPHSIAADLFRHREPKFAFTSGEQLLLEAALDGVDDTAASNLLHVGVPAIKRRWNNIFDRVTAIQPHLCPPSENGVRGSQKRQRILSYVRDHSEELRPFDFELKRSNRQAN
ncbi:MAG: hypothetical protein ACRETL_02585, partial [Gammaproteobacteria bacterium]